ncbi:trehalose 6-phosphate synthase [Allocatelliglobosispora scoriae]|uniref:Trehalose 6-phosphate synthase n=1 Tax=Allocatelliglobosispora scoriae TaxID=643052 RepID=A0A841BYG3_9ACTN|nr:trehalose 6-phosphate synthase [Allocatelliglobosispora scoriae]
MLVEHEGTWVGWSGAAGPAPVPFRSDGISLHPVALSEDDLERYYEGMSNATLWPLYHDAVEPPYFSRRWAQSYREVNERFAEAAAKVAAPDATVWVQDYQLQLVPAMLRDRRPDLKIGFFLHIPFPPIELFMQLPQRAEIVRGLLGADLIGFQQKMGAQNFVRLAHHVLGCAYSGNVIEYEGRQIKAAAYPISIDTKEIEDLSNEPEIRARAEEIRAELGNPKTIILGVDRLDYTKGIERRLKAYRELLSEERLSVPETVMVQVATPSRERVGHYQTLRVRVEREVGRINGEFGRVGVSAVHYLHQSYSRRELAALYRAADVMIVTPLRDGMNLVAKEYVASRADTGGALVLSEFAGAANELRQALLCNPHDLDALKDAIIRATNMDPEEGRRRMAAMQRQIRKHDVAYWSHSFLDDLKSVGQPSDD